MLKEKIRYGYNDVVVQPCYLSSVEHRSDVKPFDKNGMLPIFTAPMSSIVGIENADLFKRNKIYPIIPRNEEFYKRIECLKEFKWIAVSLEEAERIHGDVFLRPTGGKKNKFRVLIDVANGHMEKVYDVAEKLKKRYGDSIELMVGNISNPSTYVKCCDVGIDYLRCGIGVGLGCFHSATKITMSDGTKKEIKDVISGDVVNTKNGEFTVLSTKMVKTNTLMCINNEIKCTPNHSFFVINKTDKEKVNENNLDEYGYWIKVENLDKEKHFLIKCFS